MRLETLAFIILVLNDTSRFYFNKFFDIKSSKKDDSIVMQILKDHIKIQIIILSFQTSHPKSNYLAF